MQRLHLVHDEARLLLVVGGGIDAQLLAFALRGPEVLSQPRLVPRDDRVGGVEDVSLRAVVLLELHHLRDAEVAHELVHVADFGAAEAVDGVVRDQTRGDVVVRRVYIQVVHLAVLSRDFIDGVNEIRGAISLQHRHTARYLIGTSFDIVT